jgi:hypothetical protein
MRGHHWRSVTKERAKRLESHTSFVRTNIVRQFSGCAALVTANQWKERNWLPTLDAFRGFAAEYALLQAFFHRSERMSALPNRIRRLVRSTYEGTRWRVNTASSGFQQGR